MTDTQKIQTSGIDHIHLNVYQLDAAIDLFSSLFATTHFLPMYIESVDGNNSVNDLHIDMFEPASEDGFFAQLMAKRGEGVSSVSFRVEDIDEATDRGVAAGLTIESQIGFPDVEAQTQFRADDSFNMTTELVYYYPNSEEKVAELMAEHAKQNDGVNEIYHKPGAVAASGIDHARLRVKDVDAAIELFSRVFECDWERDPSGTSARSSIGLHLLQADDNEGVDAIGIKVDSLEATRARIADLGLKETAAPEYLQSDACICLDKSECFGVSVIAVETS